MAADNKVRRQAEKKAKAFAVQYAKAKAQAERKQPGKYTVMTRPIELGVDEFRR